MGSRKSRSKYVPTSIRFSSLAQKRRLQRKAKKAGLSLSEYLIRSGEKDTGQSDTSFTFKLKNIVIKLNREAAGNPDLVPLCNEIEALVWDQIERSV